MNEEQPLTPTPPRREIVAPSRHFAISPPWTPHNGSDKLHNDNSPSDEAGSSEILEPSTGCDSTHEPEATLAEPVAVDNEGATMTPAHLTAKTSPARVKPSGDDEPEQLLIDVSTANMRIKIDTKPTPVAETQSRKKRLTNLFRNLSASAASSTARMNPKSSAADRSLMVTDRLSQNNEAIDEEQTGSALEEEEDDGGGRLEIGSPDDDDDDDSELAVKTTSAARHVFNIGRRSPHPGQRTSTCSSKYSPMISDD